MVAISLYRGNLHRVSPDVARRWLMPTPGISIKDFRSLLFRRSKAISHLPSTSSSVFPALPTTFTASSVTIPNPNLNLVNSPPPPNQSDFNGPENPNSCPEPSNNVEITVEDAGDYLLLDRPPLLTDADVNKLVEEKEIAPVVDNPIPSALEVSFFFFDF